jgi:hypothetical protein
MSDDFAPISSDELWLCHLACVPWTEPNCWTRYFGDAQKILEADVTHLDKEDPARRRVKSNELSDVAEYVSSLGKREDSRWVFGRMAEIDVEFTLRHYKVVQGWPNSINWYFPEGFSDTPFGARAIRRLFDLGNVALSTFYGYADTKATLARKKKESGAVNIQAELIGVFWLSYFDAHYVSFIGQDKFAALQGIEVLFDGGVTLELGDSPSSLAPGCREYVELQLGKSLFVDPKDVICKPPGRYALKFDQMRCEC